MGVLTGSPPELATEEAGGRALRVLLVEDNPTNRQVMCCFLALAEANVTCAENGLEGVQAYARHHFDVVLMDLQMPVMDGYTAIREIRMLETREARARTPIVVVSANTAPQDVQAARAGGADRHLGKPVALAEFFTTLSAVLEPQETPARPAAGVAA